MDDDPRGRRVRTSLLARAGCLRAVLSARGRRFLAALSAHGRRFRTAVLVAFLAGALAHGESLSYWFTASDTLPLVASSRAAGDPVGVLARPMLAGTRFVDVALFYRPLATLSYAVDYRLWGLTPAGYHLTNVLLHGLAAAAAAVALAAVARRRSVGAAGGVLFAVHPLTAEVVPAASRRHDVLMGLFLFGALALFARSRRVADGRRSLAGSLALYALALASKEPALVFPGLVVAWVALDRERPASPDGLLAGLRAVAPYLVVTAGYLGLRVAVLGGLGGYRERAPTTVRDVATILAEYPLSLWYPQGVVGAATLPWGGPAWRLVGVAMAVAGGLVLAGAALAVRERGASVASAAALACAAAVAGVPAAVALEPHLVRTVPLLYDYGEPSIVTAYPRPSSPVVGLLLVAAGVAAAAWAARSSSAPGSDGRPARSRDGRERSDDERERGEGGRDRSDDRSDRPLRARDRTALLFFGAWLAGPLVLFVLSGNYASRSGYVSLAPASGALAVLLVAGAERLRISSVDADEARGRSADAERSRTPLTDTERSRTPLTDTERSRTPPAGAERAVADSGRALDVGGVRGADLALVGVALLVVVPLVATSPLVHAYDGWAASGEINRVTLVGVEEHVAGTPNGTAVRVEGMVRVVTDRGCSFPRAKTTLYARPGTVEAWLRLRGHDRRVVPGGGTVLRTAPERVRVERTRSDGTLAVRVSYAGADGGACGWTPWERYEGPG